MKTIWEKKEAFEREYEVCNAANAQGNSLKIVLQKGTTAIATLNCKTPIAEMYTGTRGELISIHMSDCSIYFDNWVVTLN